MPRSRKNNTTDNGGVFISMAHLGPDHVRAKFPGMVKRCADSGFDLAGGLVEVVPTAHYFMGGVVVDADTRTAMEGLYVAGEDAGGAHGSNRLGGNGVANSTVYGGVAGDVMGADIRRMGALRDPCPEVLQAEIDRALHPLTPPTRPRAADAPRPARGDVGGCGRDAQCDRHGARAGPHRRDFLGVDGGGRRGR